MKRKNYMLIFFMFLFVAGAASIVTPAFSNIKNPLAGKTTPEKPISKPVRPVHYVKVDGVVNPVMSEYLLKTIDNAHEQGAGLIVIEIDTPGGLDTSMRDIIKAILSSEVPVVVYVAPPGARAASAGVFITYAAHVAAMAPGTNIGSASPVAMGGKKMDETMTKKVTNDAVAYIESIAKKRGRNHEWAERAVRESVNISAEEALKLNVIDLIAENQSSLLTTLNGRKVDTIIGEKILNTEKAQVLVIEMNLRSRILKVIANPNIAYILMMIGMMGIYFELSNPGVILPGVVGAICLVLAFYSFQSLPVNYAGIILIGLAGVFFIAEFQVASYGFLTLAGVASLVLGSLMLFDSPEPFFRVSLGVMLPTLIGVSACSATLTYFAVKGYRTKPVSGPEGLLDTVGEAVDDLGPVVGHGKVFVEGEYWDAISDEPVKKGTQVIVVEVHGLHIKVVKI